MDFKIDYKGNDTYKVYHRNSINGFGWKIKRYRYSGKIFFDKYLKKHLFHMGFFTSIGAKNLHFIIKELKRLDKEHELGSFKEDK